MYSQELLDRIRAATDIQRLVGEYVQLSPAGNNRWKALCPFHKEKTPSFTVNGQLQIFKCFGCGAGGNAATFLMKIENIPFPEAVRRLAERAHVPLPESETPEDKERRRLQQILETAATLYSRALRESPAAAAARDYLARRRLGEKALAEFRFGWCAGDEMAKTKMHPALLERAGLTARGPGGTYERFRNRLVIPITDEHGRVIAFGGRTLDPNVQPKYINSPETPLYSKSRQLFALSHAKEAIRREGSVFLVEGYFDAVGMHMHDIHNAVAVLGTSLTEAQLGLLKRLATRLFIVYDEDTGGNEAALRGLDLATTAGFEVRVVRLPGGHDPDEYLEENGKDAFLAQAREAEGGAGGAAVPLFEFRLEIACRHADPKTEAGKVRIVKELVPFLVRVPNAIERNFHVQRLAERLGLRERDIEEEVGKARAAQPLQPRPAGAPKAAPLPGAKPAPVRRAEQIVLGGILAHDPNAVNALLTLPPEAFEGEEAGRLAGRLRELISAGKEFSVSSLMDEFQDSPATVEMLSITEPGGEEAASPGALKEAVEQLAERRFKARLKELQAEIQRTTDPEKLARLLEEKQRLASSKQ